MLIWHTPIILNSCSLNIFQHGLRIQAKSVNIFFQNGPNELLSSPTTIYAHVRNEVSSKSKYFLSVKPALFRSKPWTQIVIGTPLIYE